MTLLNVGHNYHVFGGSDQYMLFLGEMLEARGHRVIPLAARDPKNRPTPWAELFPPRVETKDPSASDLARFVFSPEARRAVREVLRRAEIDLAHLHIYYGQLTSAILEPLRSAGVPIVQTLHEYKLLCPVYSMISNGEVCEACGGHAFYRALPRRCNRGSVVRTAVNVAEAYVSRWLGDVRKVDHFFASSDFLRDKMIEHGVGAEKVSTLNNFVEVDRFEPAPEPGGPFVFFGRIERLKGVFTLARAAAAVPGTEVILAGTGWADAELRAFVEREGLTNVRLVGFQRGDALRDLIRGSRACVVPSEWYENCSLAILESMAYAKPVITTSMGGSPELVRHGETGLVVPPADADALGAAMATLEAQPAEARRMGLAGRERIEREYAPSVHYARLMELYERVLGHPVPPPAGQAVG